jgi:gliding motility-associated-like protein
MTGFQINKKVIRNLLLAVSFLLLLPVNSNGQGELPDTPHLVRVTTVDPDTVRIEWEASKDPTVDLYYMYKQVGDGWEFLYGFGSETFDYYITDTVKMGQTYIVTALDTLDGSDDRESLLGVNPHKAVAVSLEFDPCTPSNTINWTGYVGWEGNTSGYRIYGGLKGEQMEVMSFVNPITRTYMHRDVSYDTAYTYYVEAIHTSGMTSLSPIEEIRTAFPDAPELLRVDEVSVLDNGSLEMRFTADVEGQVNSFRIMRSGDTDESFSEVGTIWDSKQSQMDYIDNVATQENNYVYQVQSIYKPETCSQAITVSESNIGTSILLKSNLEGQIAQLTWTPYEDYVSGLSGYVIQRKSGDGEFIDVASVGAEDTIWQESIESVINGSQPGEIQYKVIALSYQVDGTDTGVSVSNIVSVLMETSMEVPNAFTPGRLTNSLFKPVFDFAPSKYQMIVYDRVGRKLFESSDPSQGWDGTFNGGDFVMEGVYVYYIQYTDFTTLSRTLSGNVTVIYPAEY